MTGPVTLPGYPSASQLIPSMYIDFECRQKQPPTLLGVLGGADSAPDRFEQWILDPALASASVASPRTTKVDVLANVARRLADDADRHRQQIVGWSFFDLKRIADNPEVSADAK